MFLKLDPLLKKHRSEWNGQEDCSLKMGTRKHFGNRTEPV